MDVEMLWERTDPVARLRQFGLEDGEAAAEWVRGVVAESWDIEPPAARCDRMVLSALNGLAWLGPHLAKWSWWVPRFPHLEEVARVTAGLAAQGVPVSAPIPSRSGELRVRAGGALMEVQSVIDGHLLDIANEDEVVSAGVTLASLHRALARCPDRDRPPAVGLAERIESWLAARAGSVPGEVAAALRGPWPDNPPEQLVHDDYRSANLICRNGQVVAVLDFEEVGPGYAVADLAQAATHLGNRYRDWRPAPRPTIESFVAAYCAVRPLTPAESDWLPTLLLWRTVAGGGGWHPDAWLAQAAELVN